MSTSSPGKNVVSVPAHTHPDVAHQRACPLCNQGLTVPQLNRVQEVKPARGKYLGFWNGQHHYAPAPYAKKPLAQLAAEAEREDGDCMDRDRGDS